MAQELSVNAVYQGGMHFSASAGEHLLSLDYPLQPGQVTAGPTPLQTLLSALAVCSGSTLALLLRKMSQSFDGLEVNARGSRRDEHPTVITQIALEFVIHGAEVDPSAVAKALAVAENQLCPVWAMLKPGTPIEASFKIIPA